jgi:hypothetical protein
LLSSSMLSTSIGRCHRRCRRRSRGQSTWQNYWIAMWRAARGCIFTVEDSVHDPQTLMKISAFSMCY